MKIRELTQPYIRHIVGNGIGTNFWFDTWHPIGPLYKNFTGSLLYSLCCKPSAPESEITADGKSKWTRAGTVVEGYVHFVRGVCTL